MSKVTQTTMQPASSTNLRTRYLNWTKHAGFFWEEENFGKRDAISAFGDGNCRRISEVPRVGPLHCLKLEILAGNLRGEATLFRRNGIIVVVGLGDCDCEKPCNTSKSFQPKWSSLASHHLSAAFCHANRQRILIRFLREAE